MKKALLKKKSPNENKSQSAKKSEQVNTNIYTIGLPHASEILKLERNHVGKETIEVILGPSAANPEPYNPKTDDIHKHFDENGKRITKRNVPKEQQRKQNKRKEKKNKKNGEEGWCTFPVIMTVSIVILLLVLGFMTVAKEKFEVTEKYESVDYYEVLNVARNADAKAIKKAYQAMLFKWHPDHNPECGEPCVQKMSLINEANIVLSNPETRSWHDEYGVRPPEDLIKKAKVKHGGRNKRR